MTLAAQKDWKKDFGLDGRKPPYFFSSVDSLGLAGKVPSPCVRVHLNNSLMGFCAGSTVRSSTSVRSENRRIRHPRPSSLFLEPRCRSDTVIIAPDEVHVYSGLIPPADVATDAGQAPGFVETINRVQDQLRSFLLSVESGEYFHVIGVPSIPTSIDPETYSRNLQATRQELGGSSRTD